LYKKWSKKTHLEIGKPLEDGERDDGNRSRPNVKVNAHVKDEVLNIHQLKKKKKTKENSNLKNTEKGKRSRIEAARKKNKKASAVGKFSSNGRSRVKAIIRY
jgi:hypothetical protein